MLLRLGKFIKPYRAYLALALLGALGETAADLLQPWPLKVLFDNILAGKPLPPAIDGWVAALFGHGVGGILYFALAAVLAIAILNGASTFLQDFFMPRVGHWVLHDLRRQLYWHIQRLELAYHNERRVGELFSTITSDIQAVRELIESALIGLIVNSLTLVGMIVVMLAIDWRFAFLALSITPFLFIIVYHFTRRISRRRAMPGDGRAPWHPSPRRCCRQSVSCRLSRARTTSRRALSARMSSAFRRASGSERSRHNS